MKTKGRTDLGREEETWMNQTGELEN